MKGQTLECHTAREIAMGLENNRSVSKLKIKFKSCTMEGKYQFFSSLEQNSTLKHLIVDIPGHAVEPGRVVERENIFRNNSLKEVSINMNNNFQLIADLLLHSESVESVSIWVFIFQICFLAVSKSSLPVESTQFEPFRAV